MVFDFELHKAHVGWVGELCDDAQSWEQSVGGKKHTDSERIMGIIKINTHFTVLATEYQNLLCFSYSTLKQDCAFLCFFPLCAFLLLDPRFLLLITLLLQQLCHFFSHWNVP